MRVFFTGLCLISALPLDVAAQGNDGAYDRAGLWDQAVQARARGDLQRAEELLQRSYSIAREGRVACELGRVLRQRGNLEEAEQWLGRCVEHTDLSASERDWARAEARHLSHQSGQLILQSERPLSSVIIDGEHHPEASAGAAITLRAGPHEVEVTDNEGTRTVRQAEVLPAAEVVLNLGESPADQSVRGVRSWVLWTTLATAVLALGGAVATFVVDIRRSQDIGSEAARSWEITSAALSGVAGAGLAATFVLIPFVVAHRRALAQSQSASMHRSRAWSLHIGHGIVMRW